MQTMKTLLMLVALAALLPGVTAAHPQTERYIPMGQSPGQENLMEGVVARRDGDEITLDGKTVRLEARTPVWIDRSMYGAASMVGDREDCSAGRYVEVRYHLTDDGYVAEWVKVRGQ